MQCVLCDLYGILYTVTKKSHSWNTIIATIEPLVLDCPYIVTYSVLMYFTMNWGICVAYSLLLLKYKGFIMVGILLGIRRGTINLGRETKNL